MLKSVFLKYFKKTAFLWIQGTFFLILLELDDFTDTIDGRKLKILQKQPHKNNQTEINYETSS
jgi:hypothetical protein